MNNQPNKTNNTSNTRCSVSDIQGFFFSIVDCLKEKYVKPIYVQDNWLLINQAKNMLIEAIIDR